MSDRYDVIVIGAGAAGLASAALLAKEGKRVCVLEASPYVGGRAMATDDEGYQLNLGGHLMEDPGSGITKIMAYVGKELVHGDVSQEMPVWDHAQQRWGSIRDRYSSNKDELKKVIKALLDTPYAELDRWDDRPLREWLHQHTRDQGVIDLFEFITVLECMTDDWWDHAAGENLYVRKMHFEGKRTSAYSFWPAKGWQAIFTDLADAVTEQGGDIRLGTPVSRVVVEDGAVAGVALRRTNAVLPNEIFHEELLRADQVVSTLPVWNVLRVVPESILPEWYVGQIRYLAQDKYRITWAGLYLAVDEPVALIDRKELATWLHAPTSGLSGFCFEMTAMDPSTAPEGKYLYTMGGILPGEKGRDLEYLRRKFTEFEADVEVMWPGLANPSFKRRHLVHDPSFGVIQKPGLVGQYRPHWRAPNVEGLYFASETFRSRGIGVDRAARAGLTVVEDILDRRLWPLEDGWRY